MKNQTTVPVNDIVLELLTNNNPDEIKTRLLANGISKPQADKLLDFARAKIRNTKIPTRKELVALNFVLFERALEEKMLTIAQKTLQDIGKLARIEHSLEVELPEFDASNPQPFLNAVIANLNAFSPASLGSLARFLAPLLGASEEPEKPLQSGEPITNAEEAKARILRLIKG